MHGSRNANFAIAQQANKYINTKNKKEKLYKTNAAIWYNKTCRQISKTL